MLRSSGAILVALLSTASLMVAKEAKGQRPPSPRQAPPPAETAAEDPEREALKEELRQELLRELDLRLETTREEIRDEVRDTVSSSGGAAEWESEWEDVRPRLDFLELDGYFRTRMDLFKNFDLNVGRDASGFGIFPLDPFDSDNDTVASTNLRLRVDPTFNVSEEIRIRTQVDVFDNLVYGTTPGGGFGLTNNRDLWSIDSQQQESTRFGWNSLADSLEVKRAWAEIRTPVGELRFGRMPTDFGLGMMWNDGNCLDCDHGDTVDRFSFSVKIADHVITPAIDFVTEGPTSSDPFADYPTAQPFDRTQVDDGRDYVLQLLRRDTPEELRNMRAAGRELFINYGLYLVYRQQGWDAPNFQTGGTGHGNAGGGAPVGDAELVENAAFVHRDAQAFMPDAWIRLLYKKFRLELEVGAIWGEIGSRSTGGADVAENQQIDLRQFGAVVQSELKLADDKLSLGLELGFASGDSAPGFGNFPGRAGSNNGFAGRGDWEGPQFECAQPQCADNDIRNFRFDRDYRVDLILFREILGGVTDATYIKPTLGYDISEGLGLDLALIYSMVNSTGTTPTRNRPLGFEIDAAINYLSDDGFVASLAYGVLFPLSGLDQLENPRVPSSDSVSAETAQTVRALFGVVY